MSNAFFRSSDLTGADLENANLSNISSLFFCSISDIYSSSEDEAQSDIDDCVAELVGFRISSEWCEYDLELRSIVANWLDEDLDYLCGNVEGEYEALLTFFYPSYSQQYFPALSLRGANLQGADLSDANLTGVDLSYAVLTNKNARSATYDYATLSNAELPALSTANFDDAWKSTEEMFEWYAENQANAKEESRKSTSRVFADSMSRAQQAYYLENSEFATDVASLGLGISSDHLYELGISQDSRNDITVQYALSQHDDLPSSIGVVRLIETEYGELFTEAVICESDTTLSIAVADLPRVEIVADEVICPTGWLIKN